jgi:hypothetical protein
MGIVARVASAGISSGSEIGIWPVLDWNEAGAGHISHRRTVSWQLSVMRTPVALPPILKRTEQRMPERRRFTQTTSLEERLAEEAKRLRKQAQGTPPGIERERLVRRARQAETTTRMTEWLTSRGLQAPKEVQ